MKIIHFDIGSNMAFAHNGCGDVVVTEHFLATGPRQERAAKTLRWLVRRFKDFREAGIKFDVLHYERPFSRGFDATRCGWGLAGILEAVAGGDTVVLDSTPQAIKSFAFGKAPSRGKTKMKAAERKAANVQEKLDIVVAAQGLGYSGSNEHEADAYLGLKYAERYCQQGIKP